MVVVAPLGVVRGQRVLVVRHDVRAWLSLEFGQVEKDQDVLGSLRAPIHIGRVLDVVSFSV